MEVSGMVSRWGKRRVLLPRGDTMSDASIVFLETTSDIALWIPTEVMVIKSDYPEYDAFDDDALASVKICNERVEIQLQICHTRD